MIIHLDLLNADTKQWITGDSVEVGGWVDTQALLALGS